MKTKNQTKQRNQARRNKEAAKVGKKEAIMQIIATGVFLAVLSVAIYIQF